MLDLNRTIHREQRADAAINAVVDAAIAARSAAQPRRGYLGASSLGHDCMRKMQLDATAPRPVEPRTQRIFDRGHWVEGYMVELLTAAGFRIVRNSDRIAFSQLEGRYRGHGDGMPIAGPEIEGLSFPCLWECKGLGSKGWTKLKNHGLRKAYPQYAAQVQQYMAYFDLTENPALFTAVNMDTMEVLYPLVEFDPVEAQAWSDRALAIVEAEAAGEALPKVGADRDDWRCKMCGHREGCWGAQP